ncbi:hypothetical protein O9X99_14480 [Agrobacterium salinitolerans]|uniref:Uncharacterized protein n=2 Tax=Agrobacterium salinitolerans TaxID=1183413 RepID=A0A9X3QXP7_9HYPH|nr:MULTISPECIES: hypothetical protein [Agrobacterium]MCZ7852182.1 hypothetical protein [Agrobacterium salinitolerans]MCZ7892878.1 hypothetical protein [Agrobacterium salinitolerans]MCZ7936772.1 hypothetical protein [Agrobacterium salinitolerans]
MVALTLLPAAPSLSSGASTFIASTQQPLPPGPADGMGRPDASPPPPPSKGAHFRLEQGDSKIDVKCADGEPMKACSDILMQLIDKINEESDRRPEAA